MMVELELAHVPQLQRSKLEEMLSEYADVFALTSLDVGKCSAVKHRIITGDSKLIYTTAYRHFGNE